MEKKNKKPPQNQQLSQNSFQPLSDEQRAEEAKKSAELHNMLDSMFTNADSLTNKRSYKSNLYRMLSSLLGSEIGLVAPWVGDGHMGNLVRKNAFPEEFLGKFKEVVFYKKCKGDVKNLKQYLEEWAKELGAALEVEDIFDEEELKKKGIIQTKLVTRADYEQRLKDENNDVRRIRGNQYLQYSIGKLHQEKIQKFLNKNPTLKEIKAKIEEPVAKQEIPTGDAKPKNRKKNKPKNPQELLIDAFMANFSGNNKESVELFERIINHKKATKSEKIEARFNIVTIYRQEIDKQKITDKKFKTHILAMGKYDDAPSQFLLGYFYQHGLAGFEQDYKESFRWITMAAEKGFAEAEYSLGYSYQNGFGVLQDNNQAEFWFTKAAEQNHCESQFVLSGFFGDRKDYTKSAEWSIKAAKQGHIKAQSRLGGMYGNGKGVEKNCAEAAKWFEKAAEQGERGAQFNLGVLYYNGHGVEQDSIKALELITKSAEQNYPSAQKFFRDNPEFLSKNPNPAPTSASATQAGGSRTSGRG